MVGGRVVHLTDLGLQLNVVSDAQQLDWQQDLWKVRWWICENYETRTVDILDSIC